MLIFNSKHLLIPLRHLFSHFSSNKMFWILGNKSISMLCSIFMHIKSMCECFPGTSHESSSGFTTNNVPQSKEICLPHSVGKQSLIFVSALQKGYSLNHAKLSVTFGILSMMEKLWEMFASRPDSLRLKINSTHWLQAKVTSQDIYRKDIVTGLHIWRSKV